MLPSRSGRVVAAVAGLGMFLGALDISVNVALPSIAQGLDADLQSVQWVIVAFIATRAGLVMGAGSFADRFGLRRVYIFGALCYLMAMVAISISPNLESVVGFRVLQGFGTGSLFAVSPALAAQVFPRERRGLAMGFATASQALGMLTGTLGAALLIQWQGWSGIFMGRVPFVLLALLLAVRFMPVDRDPIDSSPPRAGDPNGSFDLAGAITLMGALMCLVVGLRLGRSEGWTSPAALALLPMAPILILLFWRSERRAAWPVLPGELLRKSDFIVSCVSMSLAHFGVFVVWFVFPFYISYGLGKGPGSLGTMLATMALFYTGLSWLGGMLCDRLGAVSVGLTGLGVLAGGLLFISFSGQDTGLRQNALGMALVGSGLGLFQSAAYALMLGGVPSQRTGTASAAISLAQSGGTVLSVTILGGILALSQSYHLIGLLSAGAVMPDAERLAFLLAFQDVFRLGAGVVAAGLVVFAIAGVRRPRSYTAGT